MSLIRSLETEITRLPTPSLPAGGMRSSSPSSGLLHWPQSWPAAAANHLPRPVSRQLTLTSRRHKSPFPALPPSSRPFTPNVSPHPSGDISTPSSQVWPLRLHLQNLNDRQKQPVGPFFLLLLKHGGFGGLALVGLVWRGKHRASGEEVKVQ